MKRLRGVVVLVALIVTLQVVTTLPRFQQRDIHLEQAPPPQVVVVADAVIEEEEYSPIAGALRNVADEMYRQQTEKEMKDDTGTTPQAMNATEEIPPGTSKIQYLDICMIRKVASSATTTLINEWKQMPHANNGVSLSFVIIRDPLERLWSGFYNKCLHQIETEGGQCPHYGHLYFEDSEIPTLTEWLQKCVNNKQPYLGNTHFKPMTTICNLKKYHPNVYNLADPNFNRDMNDLWKNGAGVDPEVVDRWFPVTGERKRESYYSNAAAEGIAQHFDCKSLQLALQLTSKDYHGSARDYFPIPKWASQMSKKCREKKEKAPKKESRIPAEQRFWE
jgi:hypothetical protein